MIVARLFSTANGSNGVACNSSRSAGSARVARVHMDAIGASVELRGADLHQLDQRFFQHEGSAGLDLPEINLSLTPIDLVEGQLANVTGAQSVPSSQHKDRIVAPAERR